VRAQLDDPAVLDDRHPVRVVRREQPVCDGHDRAAVQHRGQGAFEISGRPRVEQGRRLVQDQGVRIGQHEPGQGDLLGLRSRQDVTARADDGLQTLRQRLGPVERAHGGQSRADVRAGRSGADHGHVVAQGADEDVVLLGDQGDLAA
jgi:hypothetical protein